MAFNSRPPTHPAARPTARPHAIGLRPTLTLVAMALAVMAALPGQASAQSCPEQIQVLPGDTLAIIAQECGVSLGALLQANPQIDDPSRIFAGEALLVPPPGTVARRDFQNDRFGADGFRDDRFVHRGGRPKPFVVGPHGAAIDPRRYSPAERRFFRRALRRAYRQGLRDGSKGF
ncbi:MAG: LysM domain-containing protein [Pseudomonadota bacterium]